MAITQYGVNDALSNKLWARDLNHEVKKGLEIAPLIGTGANSIIQEKTEFKGKGDKITMGLRTRLIGDGVTESQTLEGNEEALSTYSDSLFVNEVAHAVRVEGEDSIDQQRVLFNLREEARDGLSDWFAELQSRIPVFYRHDLFFHSLDGAPHHSGIGIAALGAQKLAEFVHVLLRRFEVSNKVD